MLAFCCFPGIPLTQFPPPFMLTITSTAVLVNFHCLSAGKMLFIFISLVTGMASSNFDRNSPYLIC